MPKTSSQCLTNLLGDDGMKEDELFARASIDESSDTVGTSSLHKQGQEKEWFQECLTINREIIDFHLGRAKCYCSHKRIDRRVP